MEVRLPANPFQDWWVNNQLDGFQIETMSQLVFSSGRLGAISLPIG